MRSRVRPTKGISIFDRMCSRESVNKLPFDHHSIEDLVAPRALFVVENNFLWLGPQSSWTGANAARMIWQGLGIPARINVAVSPHDAGKTGFETTAR